MKKTKITPSVLVFFLFIAACAVSMALAPQKAYSEREKRYLAKFPNPTAEEVLSRGFQAGLEDWFSDHFPFRDFWVGVNSYWNLAEGRGLQREVYLCSDGYLINAPKKLDTENFTKNLERFNSFAVKSGLPASMAIVPTSGYINGSVLPPGHAEYHDGQLFSLAGDLLTDVLLYDPREALSGANAARNVFYRTDHHLTAYGSYTLYSGWRGWVGEDYLPEDAFEVSSYGGFYGTAWSSSGYWLAGSDTLEIWDSGAAVEVTLTDGGKEPVQSDSLYFMEHLEKLDKYPVYLDGNHGLAKIHNPNGKGTILLIKDSYAHCFSTFLANHYETIYMIDLRYYREPVSDLIEENGVDSLLFLYGIDNLLTDTNSAWLM